MKIAKKARKANYQRYLNAQEVYLTAAGWTEVAAADKFGPSCWLPPDAEKGTMPFKLRAAVYHQEQVDQAL